MLPEELFHQADEEALRSHRRNTAEDALASYNFDAIVSETSHWEGCTTDHWACVVSASRENDGEARISFHVRFFPGSRTIEEAYALDMETGEDVGNAAE